ncbi:MAG: prolyl oligopeptidase family serine peptidase [Verrucomicrobia bacterium]|nr:prolyl oligopeptidase family serine peptidase [Verrucomicrobiota bacterium]
MKQVSVLLLALANLAAAFGGTNETADVAFTAAVDGTEQRYVMVLPAGFKREQPYDVLIALHGHGSDRWQFVRDQRDECRAARDIAATHGMIFVSPDYRAKTSWMGPKAEADLVQIIGELKKTHRISRVFLCGGSMGGTASLTFAALHPELADGVAAMNGTANLVEYAGFADAIVESFGGSKSAIPDEYRKRSAEFWPERFNMPVGITAGGKDDVVPSQSVVRLANDLKARGHDVLLIHREDGGHSTTYADARDILEFVSRKAWPASESSKPASPRTLIEWRFDRLGELNGWQPNSHLTDVVITNGALRCRAIGSDPILELQPRLNIPVTPWQVVEIRLKADHDGIAELFWSGTDQGRYGGFAQEKTTRFPVTGDGAWHTYRLRPFWHAERQLVRLRFDVYDATRYELESIRVIEPALSTATTNAEFDFRTDGSTWRGEDGATVTNQPGALLVTLNERAGFAAAPPMDVDAGERNWGSVRMAVNRGQHATLLFATSAHSGLHSFSFPIHADGNEHTYNLDLFASPHWRDRAITLALRPTDDPTATARLSWLKVAAAPQGEPELEVSSLAIEEFPTRANRPLTLAAIVENRGGDRVSGLSGEIRLPKGVQILSNLVTTIPALAPGENATLRWRIQADRPLDAEASAQISAVNAPAASASTSLQFSVIPKVSQRDYVPKPKPVRGPFEVGVYYFPGWKTASQWQPIQRFPERRPVLGWYREGEPEIADWHIKWAVEHGITFFAYDWYWSRGARQLEHALHDGYFKARYRSMLKFCLLWANHNAPGSHSLDDCMDVTRFWIANYFQRPEHVTVDGKPLMIIFAPQRLYEDLGADKVRAAFDQMRAECVSAGLKGLYLVACVADAAQAREAAAAGFDGVTGYTWPHLGVTAGEFRAPFSTILDGYRRNWQHMLDTANISLLPPICGGWDSRPWHGENDFIRYDRTPELFRQHLRNARQLLESRPANPRLRNVLIVEAWNEWGEGAYIEPHREFGFGYLDAIREALTDARSAHTDFAPTDIGRGPFDVVSSIGNQTSWKFNENDGGWHGLMNVSTTGITNGALTFRTTAGDPALVSPPLAARAAEFGKLRFRMRLTAGSGSSVTDHGQIYWSSETIPESAATSASFEVIADGKWHEHEVDVAKNPRWRGRITRLRFDPCEQSGLKVELDWLRLTP